MSSWKANYPGLVRALESNSSDEFFKSLADYGIFGNSEITALFDTEMYSADLLELIFSMSGFGEKEDSGIESFQDYFLRSFDHGNVQFYKTCGTQFFGISI